MANIFEKSEAKHNSEQIAIRKVITKSAHVQEEERVKVMFSMTNNQKLKLKLKKVALQRGITASALVQDFIDRL